MIVGMPIPLPGERRIVRRSKRPLGLGRNLPLLDSTPSHLLGVSVRTRNMSKLPRNRD